jgi:hypothetical protein
LKVTKGIPFTKLEVRPTEQQPNYSGPTDGLNPLLSGMPNATAMARGIFNETSPLFGSSSIFSLPSLPGIGGPSNAIGNPFAMSSLPQRMAGQVIVHKKFCGQSRFGSRGRFLKVS